MYLELPALMTYLSIWLLTAKAVQTLHNVWTMLMDKSGYMDITNQRCLQKVPIQPHDHSFVEKHLGW